MIKIFRTFGFVFLITIVLLIVLGIYSPSIIEIEHTDHLQVPQSQVWQILTDAEKTSQWVNEVEYAQYERKSEVTEGSQLKIYFGLKEYLTFRIRELNENNFIRCDLQSNQNNPVLNDYCISIKLKSLRDGTTEVNCKIDYTVNSLAGKVANKIYFEKYQESVLKENMTLFKKYLEKT